MLQAIVFALTLAASLIVSPTTASEKEIVRATIVAKASPVMLVTKAATKHVVAKPVGKKNLKKKSKKKSAPAHRRPKTHSAPQFGGDGFVKLHHTDNQNYGFIGPSTFHLTAQPPCA